MRLCRLLRTVLFALGLVVLLAVPARAELFFEGQIWGEEFEDGPGELSQLELFQTINDERFEGYEEVILIFQLELVSFPMIQEGKVRVRPKVFKADGSSFRLPLISADIEDNGVQVERTTEVTLERGDVIRWRSRFKGVATLMQEGTCQVIFGVANKELSE